MSLKNRSFLKLLDYTPAEIEQLLDLAADLKAKKKAGIAHDQLHGKNIALIFEKTSTRTRCSFEVAAHDLGMQVTYLDRRAARSAKRSPLPTPPGCWAACLTASSTAVTASRSWRTWPTTPGCRCGTA